MQNEIERIKRIEAQNYESGSTSQITTGVSDALSDPSLLIKSRNEFELVVTELKDELGHFWAQPNEKEDQKNLEHISNTLNLYTRDMRKLDPRKLYVGQVVATLFYDPGDGKSKPGYKFYRAKVLKLFDEIAHVCHSRLFQTKNLRS